MDQYQSIITTSSQQTAALGQKMAASLIQKGIGSSSARVYCLYGDLGSGKTTFTQGFARGLGIKDRLLSPTYIIVRRYMIPDHTGYLFHMDTYRLQNQKELLDLGIQEILQDEFGYVIIEWPEKLGNLLPNNRCDIWFAATQGGAHEIRISYIN